MSESPRKVILPVSHPREKARGLESRKRWEGNFAESNEGSVQEYPVTNGLGTTKTRVGTARKLYRKSFPGKTEVRTRTERNKKPPFLLNPGRSERDTVIVYSGTVKEIDEPYCLGSWEGVKRSGHFKDLVCVHNLHNIGGGRSRGGEMGGGSKETGASLC